MPQIVAVELGADWRQIAAAPAPISAAYANYPLAARWSPLWGPAIPPLANEPDDLLPTSSKCLSCSKVLRWFTFSSLLFSSYLFTVFSLF